MDLAPADLLTRKRALDLGLTDARLRSLSRQGGPWIAVRRGVYACRATWQASGVVDRHRIMVRAALLGRDGEQSASHGSGAVVQGLAVLHASIKDVHLTSPAAERTRASAGVRVHRGTIDVRELRRVDGVPVLSVARVVADVARTDGRIPGLVVADQALRSGTTRAELSDAAARQSGWPGAACLTSVVRDADGRAENPGETLLRALALELDLGDVESQFHVSDGTRTAYADLRIGRVLIEFDGRVKYGREFRRPGESPEDVLWREKKREDWLRSLGFVVVRVTWDELWGRRRQETAARLRAAILGSS
ncbi:hypothetical protein KLP28_05515 [Nocardioidaceae bacterium]|nr:hypothetical protein KLP28_05515 [Nocardioidaceae bacterium]